MECSDIRWRLCSCGRHQAQMIGPVALLGLLCCVWAVGACRPEHLLHGADTLFGLKPSGEGFDLNQVFAVSSRCLTLCVLTGRAHAAHDS
jgi:hypothetical protein